MRSGNNVAVDHHLMPLAAGIHTQPSAGMAPFAAALRKGTLEGRLEHPAIHPAHAGDVDRAEVLA
jgi:hypothetical protein